MLFIKWQAPYNPEHTTAMVTLTRLTYMCTHGHTQTHIDRETNTDKETNRNWSGRFSCKKLAWIWRHYNTVHIFIQFPEVDV